MPEDIVEDVRALVETLVSSRLKQVESDIDELKRGLKALSDDVNERLGIQEQNVFDSDLESSVTGYARVLKEWTGKTTASVLYDSTVDEFTDDGIFNNVKGKQNVAIIGFTTDGDVFGGFYSVAVMQQEQFFYDPDMFIFSFVSQGRCETPQKFSVKERTKQNACVKFYKNDSVMPFVGFDGGAGWFYLGNEKSHTLCYDMSDGFEGVEDTTLTGKPNGGKFTCCRLVAIELE